MTTRTTGTARATRARTNQPVIVDERVVLRSRELLERAESLFDDASAVADDEAERFRLFYLAAIRASGAVLAIYEPLGPVRRRRDARDAWSRIRAVAPQARELAEYFGGLSTMRGQVEAGLVRSVDSTLCARVERRAMEFLDVADATLLEYEQGKIAPRRRPSDRSGGSQGDLLVS